MRKPDDSYGKARNAFRKFGPVLLAIGGLMLLIGVGQFLITMIQAMSGGPANPPILFVALGLPGAILFGFGMQLTGVGYLRETSQYVAKETTPAAKTSVTAIKSAILDDDVPCPACSRPVEPDSHFCSHCGVQIEGRQCSACEADIEADDRFCSSCGSEIEAKLKSV